LWHFNTNYLDILKLELLDEQIKSVIDRISVNDLMPILDNYLLFLKENNGLEKYKFLSDNNICVVVDGTQFHSSQKVKCDYCCKKEHKGVITHSHSALMAAIVSPNSNDIIPLRPEFIQHQDGQIKEDCENAAFKRWFLKNKDLYKDLNMTIIGDSLYSNNPICKLLNENNVKFIFVCKETNHKTLFEYIVEKDLKIVEKTVKIKGKKYLHRFSYQNNLPIRDVKKSKNKEEENPEMVNFIKYEIFEYKTMVRKYFNTFITNYELNDINVAEIGESGRARWKIENENNNTLKTKGYNFEHNYGHGKKNLANNFVILILAAFSFHTLLSIFSTLYNEVKAMHSSKIEFFNAIKFCTNILIFESFSEILQFLRNPEVHELSLKKDSG
jgi:hypothetical protein